MKNHFSIPAVLVLLLTIVVSGNAQPCSTLNLQLQANVNSACNTNTLTAMHDGTGLPYLYVANKEGGLNIFEISNPAAPQFVVNIPKSSLRNHDVMNVSQQGNYLYLAIGNHFNLLLVQPDSSGMAIVDVANPASPVVTDIWVFPGSKAGTGIAVADGDYAYLGAMTNGLIVLDVTNKYAITFVSQYLPDINYPDPNPSNTAKYNARGMEVHNDVVYLCFDAGGLRIINVSDKANPVETGRYANPALNGLPRAYNNLVFDYPYVYVAVDYCGMEVLDVSDTSAITLHGQWNPYNCQSNPFNWFNSPGHSNEIRYDPACHLAFVSTGKSEMHVLDLSDPANPDSCNFFGSTLDSLGTWGVNIYNGQVYLAYICTLTNIPFYGNWSGLKLFTYNTCPMGLGDADDHHPVSFQNPVHDLLQVHFNMPVAGAIFLYDTRGRMVLTTTAAQLKTGIVVAGLRNGVYALVIHGEHTVLVKRMLKL